MTLLGLGALLIAHTVSPNILPVFAAPSEFTYLRTIGGASTQTECVVKRFSAMTEARAGIVFALDIANYSINKIDLTNNHLLMKIGGYGTNADQLSQPRAIAYAANGNILVIDGSVLKEFTTEGKYVKSYFNLNSSYTDPFKIAVDSSGNIFTSDGYGLISKHNSAGVIQTEFGGYGTNPGQFEYVADMTIAPNGNLYVTDQEDATVSVFSNSGTYLYSFGSIGNGDGQFAQYTGMKIAIVNNFVFVVDARNNRIEKFNLAGVYLSQFGSLGTSNGQFNSSLDVIVATDANSVLVNDSRIQLFNSNGVYQSKIENLPGAVCEPIDVEYGPNGDLYVVDYDKQIVLHYDHDYTFKNSFPFVGSYYNGFDVDEDGNIWIGNENDTRIDRYDPSGALIQSIGTGGNGDGEFIQISGLEEKDGYLYVTDSRRNDIQKFDTSGNFILKFGQAGYGDGEFDYNVYSPKVDKDGNILVIDAGPARIQKFDSNGNFISKFGSYGTGAGQFSFAVSLDFDEQGNYIVADQYGRRVITFDTNGNELSEFGTDGTGNYQFSNPWAVAYHAESGTLAVADGGINGRVQVYTKPVVPSKPIGVSGVATSNSSLKIQWQASQYDGNSSLQNYVVSYRKLGSSTWATIAADVAARSIDVTNLKSGTYEYYVQAKNTTGLSAPPLSSPQVVVPAPVVPKPVGTAMPKPTPTHAYSKEAAEIPAETRTDVSAATVSESQAQSEDEATTPAEPYVPRSTIHTPQTNRPNTFVSTVQKVAAFAKKPAVVATASGAAAVATTGSAAYFLVIRPRRKKEENLLGGWNQRQ